MKVFDEDASVAEKVVLTIVVLVMFAGLGILVWGVYLGGFDRDAHIEAACSVSPIDADATHCTFTNTGTRSGSMCAYIVLQERRGGGEIRSMNVCSGEIEPRTTVDRPVMFPLKQPRELCGTDLPRGCEMQVLAEGEQPVPLRPSTTDESGEGAVTGNTTDCGRIERGAVGDPLIYDARGNNRPGDWGNWQCMDREAASDWSRCLARRRYTYGEGCPGSQRCCPPP